MTRRPTQRRRGRTAGGTDENKGLDICRQYIYNISMRNFSEPTTTIRIKKSLHIAAKAIAEKEDRSLRSLVECLIERHIDKPTRLTRNLKEIF